MPTSTTPCPVQAVAPVFATRRMHTGGGGGSRSSSALGPRGHLRGGLGDRAEPCPEAGGQFLSASSVWMGTVPREGLVPNQQGVWRRDGIRQNEEVLVLAEEKLYIYRFQNRQPPSHCVRELRSPCRSGALLGLRLPLSVGPRPGGAPVSGRAVFSLAVCRPSNVKGGSWS